MRRALISVLAVLRSPRAAKLKPEAHTVHFALSALAIVPLAALLGRTTESVATKTGDANSAGTVLSP
jgi:Ca2+/H+ antiporter